MPALIPYDRLKLKEQGMEKKVDFPLKKAPINAPRDDAAGEAFDKVAKILGLGYPGGPLIDKMSKDGNLKAVKFPKPKMPGYDFSFSGLKTYALRTVQEYGLEEQTKADIASAFQEAVCDILTIKCRRALQKTGLNRLVVAGGVGANLALRAALKTMCEKERTSLYFPRIQFCTDNGAMIAYVGCQRLLAGESEDLSVEIYPRWSLEALKAI